MFSYSGKCIFRCTQKRRMSWSGIAGLQSERVWSFVRDCLSSLQKGLTHLYSHHHVGACFLWPPAPCWPAERAVTSFNFCQFDRWETVFQCCLNLHFSNYELAHYFTYFTRLRTIFCILSAHELSVHVSSPFLHWDFGPLSTNFQEFFLY